MSLAFPTRPRNALQGAVTVEAPVACTRLEQARNPRHQGGLDGTGQEASADFWQCLSVYLAPRRIPEI